MSRSTPSPTPAQTATSLEWIRWALYHDGDPHLIEREIDATIRGLWDRVNSVLDDHAVVATPAEWNSLRRAMVNAEREVRDDLA